MTNERNPALENLLHGISTGHIEVVRDAWRELLIQADTVVPAILAKLDSNAWANTPRGPIGRYLGVLLALLDEIDPNVFKHEIARLRATKLHVLHRRTVEIMSYRCWDRIYARVGPEIPVHISDEFDDPQPHLENLKRWVQTQGLDLSGLTRIDIIAKHAHMDYLGRYDLFYSGIILTWPTAPARGLRSWGRRMYGEFIFYHEVGHHACGHLEGGQVKKQEKEANRYAVGKFGQAHPILIGTGCVLLFPFRPLLRRYFKKKGEQPPTSN